MEDYFQQIAKLLNKQKNKYRAMRFYFMYFFFSLKHSLKKSWKWRKMFEEKFNGSDMKMKKYKAIKQASRTFLIFFPVASTRQTLFQTNFLIVFFVLFWRNFLFCLSTIIFLKRRCHEFYEYIFKVWWIT